MNNGKKHFFCLFVLYLLYALVRLPIMLSHVDPIYAPTVDELQYGTIAKEFLEGLRLPFWDYIKDAYALTTLIAVGYTIPFFKIFGMNVLALRLGPFFWHLFSLLAWYFVFRIHFSLRQTFFILLFFVLSPPVITEFSMFNGCCHLESILWTAISILIFRRFLERQMSLPLAAFLLGLLGGVAAAHTLTNLVCVLALLVYLALIRDVSIRKGRFFGIYCLAFLLGFSPWLLLNGYFGWRSVDFIRELFSPGGDRYFYFKNIYWLFRDAIPGLFRFREFSPPWNRLVVEANTFIYLLSLGSLLWSHRKDLWKLEGNFNVEKFGLFFQMILFSLLILKKDFGNTDHSLVMVPFIGMTLVSFAKVLSRRGKVALLIFLAGSAVLGNLGLIRFRQMGSTLALPGYSYDRWIPHVTGQLCDNYSIADRPGLLSEKIKRITEGRSPEIKKLFDEYFYENCFKTQ